jgi:hypothetical protein
MIKQIILGIFVAFVIVQAAWALTVTFTGPTTYADPQWRSICISNKDTAGNYSGIVEICPSSSDPNGVSACSSSTRSVGTLPASYQTFVNAWIGYWRTDHPGY